MAAPLFGVGNAGNTNGTTNVVSLAVGTEANKVMWIYLFNGAGTAAPDTIEWQGITPDLVGSGSFNGATDGWFVYRIVAPANATDDVNVTWPDSGQHGCMPFYYYDTDQTDPDDALDQVEGAGTALQNTVASAAGDTCVCMMSTVGTSTKAPASGETERVDVGTGSPGLYELAGGASLSFDVTLGTSRTWNAVGMNINAVAAGVTTRRYTLTTLGVG